MSNSIEFKLYSFRGIGKGSYLRSSTSSSRLLIYVNKIEFIAKESNIVIGKESIEGIYNSWFGFTIELKNHKYELVDFTSNFQGKKVIAALAEFDYLINQPRPNESLHRTIN